jgi:phosphoribosylformylglycinamidine synthase II
VVPPTAAQRVSAIYHCWGLQAEAIGTITETPRLVVTWGEEPVVDLPPDALASAPAYEPAAERPAGLEARWAHEADVPPVGGASGMLLRLLGHPDVASKWRVYEQYDHMVGIRTIVTPGADAAVLRIIDAPPLGIALTVDGNARWCAADPRLGAALSVLEAAANLACVGAEPVAVTDCLNFGSPERPQVFWQFREAVEGLAEACVALGVPVVGGNVSFYNEAEGSAGARAVHPTPVVAMAGLIDDTAQLAGPGFARDGDRVVLIGDARAALGASLYRRVCTGEIRGRPADPSLDHAVRTVGFVRDAVRAGLLASAHDVGDGGLAVALAEACLHGGRGAAITSGTDPATLFGERPARFVVSVRSGDLEAVETLARSRGVALHVLGTAGGHVLRITPGDSTSGDIAAGDQVSIDVTLEALAAAFNGLEV